MKSHRLARIAQVARECAAETILFDLKDPRIKMVTVTRAEVSADLQHCKIFVSVLGTEKDTKLTFHGLASAAGYVQTKLAKRLTTRYVPHVTFVEDEGIKKAAIVAKLLQEAKGDSKPENDIDDEEVEIDVENENEFENENENEDNDKLNDKS